MRSTRRPRVGVSLGLGMLTVSLVLGATPSSAQTEDPPTARAAAAFDLTGYWVSIVNEDWRWRMVTPPKGDYASVPLNDEGRRVADMWDAAQDGACDAYGVAGLLRMPTRLHITWDDNRTLTIETDAGEQTRHLHFDGAAPSSAEPTLQGHSVAAWVHPPARPGSPPPPGGSLEVKTTNMRAGWLRKNGVPYSDRAVVTEYFDRFSPPNGDEWFVVTTIVDDPTYLTSEFITSTHFRKEADGSGWYPTPCTTR